MRKNPPRTKMEPTAPKVQSRYLNGPSVSCHDHCKGATKEPTETKPINLFPRRIPRDPPDRTKLEASNSLNRIKKSPSIVPKITSRNVKNNTVVKDANVKKDSLTLSTKKSDAIEPKSRDMKPKSENSQAKKYNPSQSRTSRRRHSDIFLPNEDMPLSSSRVPKRRLSEIGIQPKKDVVSGSNTSSVRGSRINKNEQRKDSKVSVNKKPNSINPTVSSPKRGAKVPLLRSYKSLPQSELKSPRKSKPRKPIEEVVPEKTLHVVEPNNDVETTETLLHVVMPNDVVETDKTEFTTTPADSSPSSEDKVMTHDHNGMQVVEPNNDVETAETLLHVVEPNDAVETNKTESTTTHDSSPSSEENVMTHDHNGVEECSAPKEDDFTAADDQHNESVADTEVTDTKEAIRFGKLVVETTDCSLEDLEFIRGRVLTSPLSEGSSPRNLQFRQGNELDDNETEKVDKIILRRMSTDGVIHIPESHSVNVDLKHQEIAEKESPTLSNKVIEETANKLIQTRQSKVRALVGAFEKVVSGSNQTP
ncbi:hypothetical protein Lser_V15G18435 [Lactuca serriola]